MISNKRQKILNPLVSFENQWVALAPGGQSVVASAATIKMLDRKLTKLKNKDAIVTKILPFDQVFSP